MGKEVHYIGEKSTFLNTFPPPLPEEKKINVFTKQAWTMFGNSCRRRLHFLNIRRLFPYQDHPPQCVTPSYTQSSPCSSYLLLPLFSTMSGTRLDVNYWLVFSAMRSRTYGDTMKVL